MLHYRTPHTIEIRIRWHGNIGGCIRNQPILMVLTKFSAEELQSLEDQSFRNLVEYYRVPLMEIYNFNATNKLRRRERTRLRMIGLIRIKRLPSKVRLYELTPLALKSLGLL